MIGDIWSIFSPSQVGEMAPSLISKIAAESPESQALRQQLERKLQTLQKGMEICQRHSTHTAMTEPNLDGSVVNCESELGCESNQSISMSG